MKKSVIIGNGINISEWPEENWKDFTNCVDATFEKKIINLTDNRISRIFKDLYGDFRWEYKTIPLENKFIYFDLLKLMEMLDDPGIRNYVLRAMYKIMDSKFTLSEYWNFQARINLRNFIENIALINFNDVYSMQEKATLLFELIQIDRVSWAILFRTQAIYKLFKDFYIWAIKKTLLEKYNLASRKYSDTRINWLRSFDTIITLNVDGVINKVQQLSEKTKYIHGYFSPENVDYNNSEFNKYLEMNINNGMSKDLSDDWLQLVEETKDVKVTNREVIFSDVSKSKETFADFITNYEHDENNPVAKRIISEMNKVGISPKKKSEIKTNIDDYGNLYRLSGIVVIYGVSVENDESIFEIVNKNRKIKEVIVFCAKEDENNYKVLLKDKRVSFKRFDEWDNLIIS